MLHLLASLIGNDYIPESALDAVFANMKMPKKGNGSEDNRRIKGILNFLSHYYYTEKAIDKLLGKPVSQILIVCSIK